MNRQKPVAYGIPEIR